MSPVFVPGGDRIAYGVTGSMAEPTGWATWTVPVFGGEPSRLLSNSSALTWISGGTPPRVLFSEVDRDIHMSIVTAAANRSETRTVYAPASPNGMAHRSYLSPDRKWVLVVEMEGGWRPCRLVPFEGDTPGKLVGPSPGQCTTAAWSPDGKWMYFSVNTGNGYHVWRQSFPDGVPEQVTFGATEEEGIAFDPDGKSFVTSVGTRQSTLWVHDARGERQITSEGYASLPQFSADGKTLYYLLRSRANRRYVSGHLWAANLETGKHERLLPDFLLEHYSVSQDGNRIVFAAIDEMGHTPVWLATLDGRTAPRRLSTIDAIRTFFGANGDVYFLGAEGETTRFLYRVAGGREWPAKGTCGSSHLSLRRFAGWEIPGALGGRTRSGLPHGWRLAHHRGHGLRSRRGRESWHNSALRELVTGCKVHLLESPHCGPDVRCSSRARPEPAAVACLRDSLIRGCCSTARGTGDRRRAGLPGPEPIGLRLCPRHDASQHLPHFRAVKGDAVNRRQFLLAGLSGAALAVRKHGATPLLDRGFARVTEIAQGVYVTIADSSKGMQCASNGGVIVGRSAVLIVEGHMQPAGAALEIEVARMVSKAAVRGAVDTHFHLDHSFGNLAYAEQRIPILAHDQVTPLMKERYAALKGVDKAPLLAPFEKRIARAADATDKKRKEDDLVKYKWMYDAIDAATLAFPTEPLAPAQLPMRIDLGGLTAVIESHPGHTVTDLIVRVPDRDIVFTGDLLFNGSYPVSVDADMIAWRKALDRLAAFGRRTQFVPGHRAVCGLETVAGAGRPDGRPARAR